MDLCKDALLQYDNDVTRALNHVLENGAQQHVQESRQTHVQSNAAQQGRPVQEDQLATALQSRLQVGGSGDSTPTNCVTPVKSNTPRSGEFHFIPCFLLKYTATLAC